jgi:tetratricopeptide (TPR) repeat protein
MLKQILIRHPRFVTSQCRLFSRILSHEKLPEEITRLEEVIQESDAENSYTKYIGRFALEKWDEVKKLAEEALHTKEDDEKVMDANAALAFYYVHKKEYNKAVEALEKSFEFVGPQHPEGIVNITADLIEFFCSQHMFVECEQFITHMLAATKNEQLSQHLHQVKSSVNVLLRDGHLLSQEKTYEQLAISPNVVNAMSQVMPYDWRGSYLMALFVFTEDKEMALKLLDQSINCASNPRKLLPLFQKGSWLLQENNVIVAAQCFQTIVDSKPEIDSALVAKLVALSYANLVYIGESNEEYAQKARELAEKAVQMSNSDLDNLSAKGLVLYRTGKLEEAVQVFKKIAETGDMTRLTFYANVLHELFTKTGDKALIEEAYSIFKKLVRANDQDAFVHLRLAQTLHILQKNEDEMLEHLRKSLSIEPNNLFALILSLNTEKDETERERSKALLRERKEKAGKNTREASLLESIQDKL